MQRRKFVREVKKKMNMKKNAGLECPTRLTSDADLSYLILSHIPSPSLTRASTTITTLVTPACASADIE